ncbi:hypothetical protein O1Q96_18235 [Streptomyces sp. Qhu-G9]|uniref:hypothetical protein n=1 Tax=Streptomyces sp. Qhu-G9 TaxID=3452799 RepID=UPI0022AC4FE4|nr:hypothetical protein [Streptomyces aurantiacus]WAU81549.1 hypothetical protein O1Q96_18235 [Streptomyces aurantiacus]
MTATVPARRTGKLFDLLSPRRPRPARPAPKAPTVDGGGPDVWLAGIRLGG